MTGRIPPSGIMVNLYVEAVSGEIPGELAGEANGKGGGSAVIDSILRTEYTIGLLLRNLLRTISEKSVRRLNAGRFCAGTASIEAGRMRC